MEKLKKQRNIAWIVCSVSLIMIFVLWSLLKSDSIHGWFMYMLGFAISILVSFCSLIIAINKTVNYSKSQKSLRKPPKGQSVQDAARLSVKNNFASSVISLTCAIFLTLVPTVIYISEKQSPPQGGEDLRGFGALLYYIFAGIPLFLAWLIFGILGIKSSKCKLAIVSLVSVPIYFIIYFLVGLVQAQTR
ncbi:hypothetical protein IKF02_00550 [Candidatus Saccharibacteria bacterium]|nr:hypothetical protein [Candidatus Saccharibacteria bacterium]